MKVLVDTSVWSLALRRKGSPEPLAAAIELGELINDLRAELIGPIRMELLSGIRHRRQLEKLRDTLRSFVDITLETEDFERAAEYRNVCRKHGVQGSLTDFLICAAAIRRSMTIFTIDDDFLHFREHIPIQLHRSS